MKIKLFAERDLDDIEAKVNEYLKEIPDYRVSDIKLTDSGETWTAMVMVEEE